MDIFSFVGEITVAVVKHGWSASTLVVFIFALFKFAPFRRFVMRHLPRKLKMLDNRMDSMDVRMKRMESKLDAIMSAGGVTWVAAETTSLKNITPMVKSSSRYGWVTAYHAVTARLRTMARHLLSRNTGIKQSLLMEGNKPMKSKLLSRKLWMTILGSVVLVLNQQLGWELSADSIVGIGSLFISFILGQSIVDTNGKGQFAPILEKLKSSKLWVSLIGSVLIGFNDLYQWGMTTENIYTLVGLAVTFIIGKSTVSFAQAKNSVFDETKTH